MSDNERLIGLLIHFPMLLWFVARDFMRGAPSILGVVAALGLPVMVILFRREREASRLSRASAQDSKCPA